MTFTENSQKTPIVFFDGVCNLCNEAVLFFIDHNPKNDLRFASLQSDAAQTYLGKKIEVGESPSSVLFLENGILHQKSNAVLKIAKYLSFPWNLFPVFRFVPGFLRDTIYDWIAKNRYRWFGKSEACRMPDPNLKFRFLED
ncbi:thiol-disulfide oxidoreductase DCC family protein [Leptospira alstonii]|uniref:PF04134 family protein n=2 Tax=Leptospira alstonii TaxID=28452 RepID=M6CUK0_9LEPT|nr:DCC1-like thiol-disulfide oxidoreductase family protein [Leptospira alstonii]EMJ92583.1 PF04134 family protein [Leptospira alstonii serovar Sichuan str. 79601]EQA79459.1 PF04134 family protein [Leptospira alstonii serovar Pingchang str. 80-412]